MSAHIMHTHVTSQREAIANCRVGTTLRIRYVGGQSTRYTVVAIKGDKARELELAGVRGAQRWLVDGADAVWLRDPTAAKRKGSNESGGHRRVISIVCDAWEDALLGALDEVDSLKRELEEQRRRNALIEAERDMRRDDATRCRVALQQLLELARGRAPSGHMLPSSTSPESVVAAVGHALRVEAMKDQILPF